MQNFLMNRVLVLSESWYPQGGGAELATFLYTKKMHERGMDITVVTNSDATSSRMHTKNFSFKCLPISKSDTNKITLMALYLLRKGSILDQSNQYDIAYITGKMLFVAPYLKKKNPHLKIISHLHDYQLVCPNSSLHNFIHKEDCANVWSNLDCVRCMEKFEKTVNKRREPVLLSLSTPLWKHIHRIPNILESVDHFITVSRKQAYFILGVLGDYARNFKKKNVTLYNPIPRTIEYIPPSCSNISIGFFGGQNYLKGIDRAISIIRSCNDLSLKLLATNTPIKSDSESVQFLGHLTEAEIENLYRRISLVLFTSLWNEPLPYVIAEAQLRGRPVVASNVGGVAELIAKPGFTGDTVEEGGNDFKVILQKYLETFSRNTLEYSKDVSDTSREFFGLRTTTSYESFLKMLA